ncbi:hypothetical protein CXZ10_15120 [Pleomorphomonas diazotrophica]|uniref:HTH araC/xylS-type domain-containing protein n=1 Tax=Pleomorphomonas diazotrophica TaxID=1166257 RepID=A0A1I4UN90_9HYPH|nr:helix-turn-helix transcriptional regulator [Pleomorphomonas diazotrophica]PKR88347.1 hypothetical protein CXZ10_15120 [Pleomorphomonas diazotrophica]SFM90385.1 AraC-type DNA-binding protein [Pleomorphomonas diazotrophica]
MRGIGGRSGRTSFSSEYRGLDEVRTLFTGVYGPSVSLTGSSDGNFSFRTSIVRDGALWLSHCHTGDDLTASFDTDRDDIVILTKLRGDFAIRTRCGDQPQSRDVGFVFPMNHTTGYSSTRSTATTALQIGRDDFDAALRQYAEDAPVRWSGMQDFSLGSRVGHLMQALSAAYRESFEAGGHASEASLDLIRSATIVAIAELVDRGHDGHRREKLVASRRNVMRAVELIASQTAPLTIHDLASSLDISVRALQDGFRKHLNASPHNVLKNGRIEGARRDLLSGKVGSVRDAAARWGFTNIARFAHDYQSVVGETPRETLGFLPHRDEGAS